MFFGQQILLSTHFLGDVQILREQIKPCRMLIIMKEHIDVQNKTQYYTSLPFFVVLDQNQESDQVII